jgi:hypothetical protein
MSLWNTAEFLIGGLMGLGFTFIIASVIVQSFYDYASPLMISLGWSYFGMQNYDVIMYACDNMIPVGLGCLVLSTILWVANGW